MKLTKTQLKQMIRSILEERPYIATEQDEVVDLRVELWPDWTPEERLEMTQYIDGGGFVYGILGDNWVSFEGEHVELTKQEPQRGRRMPDDWINYVYIAL